MYLRSTLHLPRNHSIAHESVRRRLAAHCHPQLVRKSQLASSIPNCDRVCLSRELSPSAGPTIHRGHPVIGVPVASQERWMFATAIQAKGEGAVRFAASTSKYCSVSKQRRKRLQSPLTRPKRIAYFSRLLFQCLSNRIIKGIYLLNVSCELAAVI